MDDRQNTAPLPRETSRHPAVEIVLNGCVQGVGFRPFVVNLARQMGLMGRVWNEGNSVRIFARGQQSALDHFLERLRTDKPPSAVINDMSTRLSEHHAQECSGHTRGLNSCSPDQLFSIAESRPADREEESIHRGVRLSAVPLDTATCTDCLREMRDPGNRRYRYPFVSCATCGPRYSIIERMPFDRASTAMRDFPLCRLCAEEHNDPSDRRFHAQTISCPACGPVLELWQPASLSSTLSLLARGEEAWRHAVRVLRGGGIIGLKGLGGYQLVSRADSDQAVRRLRQRKGRRYKPLAVQVGTLAAAQRLAETNEVETAALVSTERPIVLLRKKKGVETSGKLSASVCQGLSTVGIMLPASGLHELLAHAAGVPLVVTSGNCEGEPMSIDDHEACTRWGTLADLFLRHNRRIVNRIDDSVVRILGSELTCIRPGRGRAPYLFQFPPDTPPVPQICVAYGGHHAASAAVAAETQAIIGPHLGDWGPISVAHAHAEQLQLLLSLFGLKEDQTASGTIVLCDAHPDCHSRLAAESLASQQLGSRLMTVPHHEAHAAACWSELKGRRPDLVKQSHSRRTLHVVWDGYGYGGGGEARGGEFYFTDCEQTKFTRIGHLRAMPSLGGDIMAREPRRSALAVLWELFGSRWKENETSRGWFANQLSFSAQELRLLEARLSHSASEACHSPKQGACRAARVSSAGRLMDAAAALMGLTMINRYEGHAPLLIESLADSKGAFNPLSSFKIRSIDCAEAHPAMTHKPALWAAATDTSLFEADWQPLMQCLLTELKDMPKIHDGPEPFLTDSLVRFLSPLCSRFLDAWVGVIADVSERVDAHAVCLSGGVFQNKILHDRLERHMREKGVLVQVGRALAPNDAAIAAGQILYHQMTRSTLRADAKRR